MVGPFHDDEPVSLGRVCVVRIASWWLPSWFEKGNGGVAWQSTYRSSIDFSKNLPSQRLRKCQYLWL